MTSDADVTAGSRRARWRIAAAIGAIVGVVALVSVVILFASRDDDRPGAITPDDPTTTTDPTTPAGPAAGMRLVFAEDFAGASLDSSRWATCYPWADEAVGCTNFGNPELQWHLPSQVAVSDGALHLVATRTPTAGTTRNGRPETYAWRSGMVTTFKSFVFTYGYVEVTARIPAGDGLWTALFLLPQDQTFPPEIDIAEVYGVDPGKLSVTFHPPAGERPIHYLETDDLSTDEHTYGVRWEPDSITWYLDGDEVYRYDGPAPTQPMYFLANLTVATFFGSGTTDATPDVASLDIQRVAVYQE